MICSMASADLRYWVKNKAKPGDIAYWFDELSENHYFYVYKEPDDNPCWRMLALTQMQIKDLIEKEEAKMNKRCENCKYFKRMGTGTAVIDSWCEHEKHSGVRVAAHTTCPEHEPKKELTTPFDGVRFYLINACTGEIGIKYICEDCGKEMKKPYHWWLQVPYGNAVPKGLGFHYRCEECDKKKEGKI